MIIMPSCTPRRPSRSPPSSLPLTISSRARAIARRKIDVAIALALVLDQQHLTAQRTDDFAAVVANREDLLQHGRAADHGRRDLVSDPTVEEQAEDQRHFIASHGSTDVSGKAYGLGTGTGCAWATTTT